MYEKFHINVHAKHEDDRFEAVKRRITELQKPSVAELPNLTEIVRINRVYLYDRLVMLAVHNSFAGRRYMNGYLRIRGEPIAQYGTIVKRKALRRITHCQNDNELERKAPYAVQEDSQRAVVIFTNFEDPDLLEKIEGQLWSVFNSRIHRAEETGISIYHLVEDGPVTKLDTDFDDERLNAFMLIAASCPAGLQGVRYIKE
jgi:hypothetical protein